MVTMNSSRKTDVRSNRRSSRVKRGKRGKKSRIKARGGSGQAEKAARLLAEELDDVRSEVVALRAELGVAPPEDPFLAELGLGQYTEQLMHLGDLRKVMPEKIGSELAKAGVGVKDRRKIFEALARLALSTEAPSDAWNAATTEMMPLVPYDAMPYRPQSELSETELMFLKLLKEHGFDRENQEFMSFLKNVTPTEEVVTPTEEEVQAQMLKKQQDASDKFFETFKGLHEGTLFKHLYSFFDDKTLSDTDFDRIRRYVVSKLPSANRRKFCFIIIFGIILFSTSCHTKQILSREYDFRTKKTYETWEATWIGKKEQSDLKNMINSKDAMYAFFDSLSNNSKPTCPDDIEGFKAGLTTQESGEQQAAHYAQSKKVGEAVTASVARASSPFQALVRDSTPAPSITLLPAGQTDKNEVLNHIQMEGMGDQMKELNASQKKAIVNAFFEKFPKVDNDLINLINIITVSLTTYKINDFVKLKGSQEPQLAEGGYKRVRKTRKKTRRGGKKSYGRKQKSKRQSRSRTKKSRKLKRGGGAELAVAVAVTLVGVVVASCGQQVLENFMELVMAAAWAVIIKIYVIPAVVANWPWILGAAALFGAIAVWGIRDEERQRVRRLWRLEQELARHAQQDRDTTSWVIDAEKRAKATAAASEMPMGWETAVSRSTGATYYVNPYTHDTTYDLPTAPALPMGWETAVSRSTGATYYVNPYTHDTTYDLPTAPALPSGWDYQVSRSTGDTYYVNTYTEETQFDFPTEPAEGGKREAL